MIETVNNYNENETKMVKPSAEATATSIATISMLMPLTKSRIELSRDRNKRSTDDVRASNIEHDRNVYNQSFKMITVYQLPLGYWRRSSLYPCVHVNRFCVDDSMENVCYLWAMCPP